MNKNELLPCPFCGSVAEIEPSEDSDFKYCGLPVYARCTECPAKISGYLRAATIGYEAEKERAIKLWNTRK